MDQQSQEPARTPEQQEALIRELKSQLAASEEEGNRLKKIFNIFAFESRQRFTFIQGYAELIKRKDEIEFEEEEIEQYLSSLAKYARSLGHVYDYFLRLLWTYQDVDLTQFQ